MNRRDFLSVVTKTVAGVGLVQFLISCGKNTQAASTDITITSSTDSGHSHTFTITAAELAAGAALAKNDSVTGHSHLVSVTAEQMASIATGSTVNAVAAAGSTGHTHTYALKKS